MPMKHAQIQQRITRKILHLAIVAIFLVSTVSCSMQNNNNQEKGLSGSGTEENTSEITLRFVSSWGGVDSKAETLKEVLSRFQNDNPGIKVENESIFGEDFLPKIKTDFASGNDPEVFGLWPGSDIRALIKANKVADLTSYLKADPEWQGSFKDGMWEYTTFNNCTYGLPVEIIIEGLFVNIDLFEKYDVKIPQTYDELKQAVTTFKKNDIIPIAFNTMAEGTFLYQCIIAMLGEKSDVEMPGDSKYVKNCYIEAMKYIKELYSMGAFPQEAFKLTNNERNTLFKEKKAAMVAQGSWFIGDFAQNLYDVDIVTFPKISEGKAPESTLIYGLGCGNFHMSAKADEHSEKRDASIKLLKALTSRETAVMFATKTGMISNIDFDDSEVAYNRLTQKAIQLVSDSKQLVGTPDSYVDRSCWEGSIVQQLPYYLEGRISAAEVWDIALKNGINGG